MGSERCGAVCCAGHSVSAAAKERATLSAGTPWTVSLFNFFYSDKKNKDGNLAGIASVSVFFFGKVTQVKKFCPII
jgi:hypothetical protein